jgi:hypothetical protein
MFVNIMSLIPGVSVPLKSIISRLVEIFKQQIFAVKKSKANNLCSYSKTLEILGVSSESCTQKSLTMLPEETVESK